MDQLVGGRAIRGYNAANRADIANVADESACIDIPDSRDLVAI